MIAVQTGLRVSELIGLRRRDVHLGVGAHIGCRGKGRKAPRHPADPSQRRRAAANTSQNEQADPDDPLFPGPHGDALGRDAVRRLVQRHANSAVAHCSSLASKIVSPHTLRHTCAMRFLESRNDPSTIALWLGHESPVTSQIYLHAHLALKERAIARTAPPNTTSGRYRPPDKLIAFLEQL